MRLPAHPTLRPLALLTVPPILLVVAGCDLSEPEPEKPTCELVGNNVAGKSFVMVEATPSGDTLNDMARMQFTKDGDDLVMKYTVKSLANVYKYTCSEGRKGRLDCVTEPNALKICAALEVHKEGSCNAEKVKALGFDIPEAELTKAMEEAKKAIAEVKGTPQWQGFALANNNVANAVQGTVYVKVDERKCRLNVDDMMTIVYEGAVKQDYNPVGANPFALTEDTLLFEDCPNQRVFADHDKAELPTDEAGLKAELDKMVPLQTRPTGEPVYYHYLDEIDLEAKEGCTYAADLYANYEQVQADVAIETVDGKNRWNASHTWSDDDRRNLAEGKKGGIFSMVRKKTCGGETEVIDSVCNFTVF